MPEPPVMPPAPAPLDLAAIRARLAQAYRVRQWGQPWQDFYDSQEVVPYSQYQSGPMGKDQALSDMAALLAEVDRLRDLVDYYQAQHLMPGWPGPQP